MDKTSMLDAALERLMTDMDDVEGAAATAHSADECPDPLNCGQHDSEFGKSLTPEGEPAAVKIEIHKAGGPSMAGVADADDKGAESDEGLSPEESEMLKKLLK